MAGPLSACLFTLWLGNTVLLRIVLFEPNSSSPREEFLSTATWADGWRSWEKCSFAFTKDPLNAANLSIFHCVTCWKIVKLNNFWQGGIPITRRSCCKDVLWAFVIPNIIYVAKSQQKFFWKKSFTKAKLQQIYLCKFKKIVQKNVHFRGGGLRISKGGHWNLEGSLGEIFVARAMRGPLAPSWGGGQRGASRKGLILA